MAWSDYIVDRMWHAKESGVAFAEPIRKRDEKLFEKRRCTFCREEFFVSRKLEPKPEACERCFRARKAVVSTVQRPDDVADDHKVQIPER